MKIIFLLICNIAFITHHGQSFSSGNYDDTPMNYRKFNVEPSRSFYNQQDRFPIDYDYFTQELQEENNLGNKLYKQNDKNNVYGSDLNEIPLSDSNTNFGIGELYSALKSHNVDESVLNEFLQINSNSNNNEQGNQIQAKTTINPLKIIYETPKPVYEYKVKPSLLYRQTYPSTNPPKIATQEAKNSYHTNPSTKRVFSSTRPPLNVQTDMTSRSPTVKTDKLHINSMFALPSGKLSPKFVSELEEILPIIFKKLDLSDMLSKQILGSKNTLHSIILEMVKDENVESAFEMMNELSVPGIEDIPEFISKIELSSLTDMIRKTDLNFISTVLETLGVDTEYLNGVFSRVGATSPHNQKAGGTDSKLIYLPLVDASSVSNVQALGFTVLLFFLLASYLAYIEYGLAFPGIRPVGVGSEIEHVPAERIVEYAEPPISMWLPSYKFPSLPSKPQHKPKLPLVYVHGRPGGKVNPPKYTPRPIKSKFKHHSTHNRPTYQSHPSRKYPARPNAPRRTTTRRYRPNPSPPKRAYYSVDDPYHPFYDNDQFYDRSIPALPYNQENKFHYSYQKPTKKVEQIYYTTSTPIPPRRVIYNRKPMESPKEYKYNTYHTTTTKTPSTTRRYSTRFPTIKSYEESKFNSENPYNTSEHELVMTNAESKTTKDDMNVTEGGRLSYSNLFSSTENYAPFNPDTYFKKINFTTEKNKQLQEYSSPSITTRRPYYPRPTSKYVESLRSRGEKKDQ